MIEVVNINKIKIHDVPLSQIRPSDWPEKYVYIGRAGHGHDGYLGNPCLIIYGQHQITEANRCPVCDQFHINDRSGSIRCYESYVRQRIAKDHDFANRVKSLSGTGVKLVCFCKPKPCHGDILAKIIEELNG